MYMMMAMSERVSWHDEDEALRTHEGWSSQFFSFYYCFGVFLSCCERVESVGNSRRLLFSRSLRHIVELFMSSLFDFLSFFHCMQFFRSRLIFRLKTDIRVFVFVHARVVVGCFSLFISRSSFRCFFFISFILLLHVRCKRLSFQSLLFRWLREKLRDKLLERLRGDNFRARISDVCFGRYVSNVSFFERWFDEVITHVEVSIVLRDQRMAAWLSQNTVVEGT